MSEGFFYTTEKNIDTRPLHIACSFPENYGSYGLQKQISKDLKQQAFNNSESDHIHAQAHPVMPGQSYEYVAALLVHYL
jgi:hypothetical protein